MLTPEAGEGPFYLDPRLVRADITSGQPGAPLLGLKGVCIICHGRSNANAIKNAVRVAVQSVRSDLSRHIAAEMAQHEAGSRA